METLAGGKLLLDFPAEAVARLRIANPERRNALDHEILGAIAAALPRLDDGIATRCVLITGTPPLFSAGYDIAGFTEDAFEDETEALVAHPFQAAMEAIVAHPWPTVAAINGLCLGGGLELAVSCDLRIAAAGAKLGMPPAKLGLIYGHTGLRRFLETIGLPRTREMFFTGRNLDAARAEAIGLVNEVVEDVEIEAAGVELAAEIAAAAPLSTRGNKRVIDVLAANPVLSDAQEEELVELRRSCFGSGRLPRGHPRLRREAPPGPGQGASRAPQKQQSAARGARRRRPGDGRPDRADRPARPRHPPAPPQRGTPARRLRGAAALDRRPAGLDQSGPRDLPARARPLRRQHPHPGPAPRGERRGTARCRALRPQGRIHPRPRRSTSRKASWTSTGSRRCPTRTRSPRSPRCAGSAAGRRRSSSPSTSAAPT